jgi:hypothetical protein
LALYPGSLGRWLLKRWASAGLLRDGQAIDNRSEAHLAK